MQDADLSPERPTPMHSAADLDFDRRRRNDPPWGEGDRADALFGALPKQAWFKLISDLGPRWMRVGEVGYAAPNAVTQHFGDNSCSVVINSGLFDFVRAVSLTLFGDTHLHGPEKTFAAPLTPHDTATRLAALYEQWKSGGLWRGERVQMAPIDLSAPALADAEHLAKTAMVFILSHETGHAVLHGDVRPQERTPAQEDQADDWGFELSVLGYGLGANDTRMAIVGATVALRMLSALTILGHAFPGNHPPPAVRLAALREALLRMSDGEASYYDNTTIAYAFEEMMQMAENVILGRGMTSEVTAERLVSRLWSGLIEYRREQLSFADLNTAFQDDVRDASGEARAQAGLICRRLLSAAALGRPGQAPFVDEQLRVSIGAFDKMVEALPPPLAADFLPPPPA